MAYRAVWGDFSNQYFKEDAMEFPYHFWDDKKIRGMNLIHISEC